MVSIEETGKKEQEVQGATSTALVQRLDRMVSSMQSYHTTNQQGTVAERGSDSTFLRRNF